MEFLKARRKTLIMSLLALGSVYLYARTIESILTEPVTSWVSEVKADCGIVLTGGGGRIKEGFSLLSHKTIKRLIISGVHSNASIRDIMPTLPFYGDIAEENVFLDKQSGTTYGNAQQTLPIVEALHCRDIVLITSQLHMGRAFQTFKASYPDRITIKKHTIPATKSEMSAYELSVEVLKNIFYSIWAF